MKYKVDGGKMMTRSILVTSGKGGVGKTTLVANLGLALANMGYQVCVVDMDLGLKNLDVTLGLENRLVYDAKDVMEGKCSIEEALVQDKRTSNLHLLSVCKTVNLEKVRFEKLKFIIDEIKPRYNFLLFDSPAGIEKGFQYSMQLCDEAISVIQLDITSMMDCDRIIGILLRNQIQDIQIVINRVNPQYIQKKIQCTMREALDYLALPCAGVVYEDAMILMGNNLGNNKMSALSLSCYEAIARRITHEEVDIPKYPRKNILQKLMG